MTSDNIGSDPLGRVLGGWTCARSHDSQGALSPCSQVGASICSKCRQVKYCSRECQAAHWKRHKPTCSSPYASKGWLPSCDKEGRPPAYLTMDDSDTMPASPRFGTDRNYLWGDLPACDILNVPTNEGVSIKNQDLNLCFAASGDPRNLIKTVNGLPLNYSGRCTLVINDHHPQVAIRNLIILGMLLDPCGPSIELAAEAALHALYSASLTSAQYDFVGEWMDRVSELGQRPSQPFHGEIKFNSDTSMEWLYPEQVGTLLQRIKAASYSKAQSEADRRRVMLSSQRLDYRELYYIHLRPRHRVGHSHWLDTGVLLPFGQPVDSFDQPNRLLYSERVEWLLVDHDNPVYAWNPLDVEKTRKEKGLPEEDSFGSLFFHIKQELMDFITRARQFHLSVRLFSVGLNLLPQVLDSAMEGTQKLMFDRVETSNVMDTTGPSSIISSWGPRLNRKNPNAALLMYSATYCGKVQGGSIQSQSRENFMKMVMELSSYLSGDQKGHKRGLEPPSQQSITRYIEAFFDTRPAFMEYLRQESVPKACGEAKVRQREIPRILPVRIGVGLKDYDRPKIGITPEEFYFVGQ
ncbi:hypothetical protein M407DRAFT_17476 [Tulasnella calospora MUT 4182]|uniref:MYND-type domain-containing protein n=1 Tax=Tulasnella calospora MUT 4182 TaxID=1051891 RepID=A0A0C3QM03_9AGAM|nr:hypothetical protein M407DRAFT_17476 [Tulasnella calospora MUT 4182]